MTVEIPAVWVSARTRWESPDGRYYFDQEAADKACDFFPTFLIHHIGAFAGQPFELLPYQTKLLTRPLFGWKRTSTGLRRFRNKVFAFLPKGSGKSPWGAGTGLYLTLCDHESAAEVFAVAGDKLQARIVHENAKIFVEESPVLSQRCEITKDAIVDTATRSTYQVISADAATKHGLRPHGVVFDEFHAQPKRDLFEALRKSLGKRRQPAMIIITHAGDNDEGICAEEYDLAKAVLSGTAPPAIVETTLPVIFEADPTDDWTDPAVWRRVNPGHGITIQHDAVATECAEAQMEPRKVNDFLRFHLNRWVAQATAWIPVDWWDQCDEPMPSDEDLAACPCAVVGIDMAQKIDLAAAVAVFRLPLAHDTDETTVTVVAVDDRGDETTRQLSLNYRIAIVPAFWLPEETLRDRVRQDNVPYDVWAEQGLLHPVEGAIVSSEPIVRYLVDLLQRFSMLHQSEFAYDPAFATEVGVRLRDHHNLQIVEVPQNFTHLSEACLVFEALVKARRVVHGGHRLLRWCVENVAVKRDDAGRIRPVKPRRATKRIDGVSATIIALTRLILQPEAPEISPVVGWIPFG